MKPERDDETIRLPVTFDYHGGRADNTKSNVIVGLVLFVISVFLTIMFLRNKNNPFTTRLLMVGAVWLIYTVFLRFKLLRESTYSDAYETLKEVDNIPDTSSFWNIYEIDDVYPYVCHFKNGLAGVFIRLERDVVVGKPDDLAYTHYEAISDAYNAAGSLSINMVHIDYMDNVGNDTRMQSRYDSLDNCTNPDMREAMLSIYANLQDDMSQYYTSYDVYLFTTKLKQDQLWYNVKTVIDRFLGGNYVSYSALDIDGIRSTCVALFNLTEFSAIEACENTVKGKRLRGIVPIRLENNDGVRELGKTQEQIRQERLEADRAKAEKKNRLWNLSKGKSVSVQKVGDKPTSDSNDTDDIDLDVF